MDGGRDGGRKRDTPVLKELDADGNDVHVAKGKGEGGAVKERGGGGTGCVVR